MKEGEIVFEQHVEGSNPDKAYQIASGTKSFWGPAAVAAIEDGLFTLDEPVAETITEWKADPRKSKITVRHLLSFSSGLEAPRRLWAERRKDLYALVLELPAVAEPGTTFAYSEVHLYAFGEFFKRKLAAKAQAAGTAPERPWDYLNRKILTPIGLTDLNWARDGSGNRAMGDGAVLTARQWAKYGELVRLGGLWEGKQLLPKDRLAGCFESSSSNPAYGFTFWLNKPSDTPTSGVADRAGSERVRSSDRVSDKGIVPGRLPDLVMAAGAGQQRLWIDPIEKLVVVRFANADMPRLVMAGDYAKLNLDFRDEEFFARLLGPAAVPEMVPAAVPAAILEFPGMVDTVRGTAPGGRKVPIKVHVPASGGPYPVVVVSHGAGGNWDTHFAQAQDLASHGYAVLCVEHVGSNRQRLTQGLRVAKNLDAMIRDADEVLARPRDVSFAIQLAAEWNESHPQLKGRLDLDRVGVMGHSFGAYTTMVVCGMRPALDWMTPTVAPGQGLGPDLSDPRVKCGVALSPQSPGEPFFLAESFASLRVPLLGITGSKDDQQAGKTAKDRKDSFALWPKGDHRLIWLANAQHLDFSDASGSGDRALPSRTRADVQPITRAATRAFFDLHLKGDANAATRLTVDGLKPQLRGAVDGVEVLAK